MAQYLKGGILRSWQEQYAVQVRAVEKKTGQDTNQPWLRIIAASEDETGNKSTGNRQTAINVIKSYTKGRRNKKIILSKNG